MRELNLSGIMPPLATPFKEDGSLDLEGLEINVTKYNEAGLSGYVVLGSNGEAVHLTAEEKMRVIEVVRRAAPNHMLIAGAGELSTSATIEASRRAADAGAEAVLIITPHYYKGSMDQAALLRHYMAVADGSPVPIILYSFPQATGIALQPTTIAQLTEHPNIIGLKDSSGDMGALVETLRLVPAGFAVLVGNGQILYPSLLMGAKGAILAVACVAPRACVEIYLAAMSADHAHARWLQEKLVPLSRAVTSQFGIAGLKAAMQMAGYRAGPPRAPLRAASQEESEKIKAIMRQTGLFADLQ
jgi:4-hydroxy-2-oxoglutarate aldolase